MHKRKGCREIKGLNKTRTMIKKVAEQYNNINQNTISFNKALMSICYFNELIIFFFEKLWDFGTKIILVPKALIFVGSKKLLFNSINLMLN